MILRAISDMAVATTVRSLPEIPATTAISRPLCRARTTSASRSICRQTSSIIEPGLRAAGGEHVQAALEIERGGYLSQPQAKLHHGEGHVRLDADDDGARAAQPGDLGETLQGAGGEGIHH